MVAEPLSTQPFKMPTNYVSVQAALLSLPLTIWLLVKRLVRVLEGPFGHELPKNMAKKPSTICVG